jgi:CRISPR-associated protein Cas1
MFRKEKVLARIIPTIEEILAAGEMQPPPPHEEAVPIAIPNAESIGDVGHRS